VIGSRRFGRVIVELQPGGAARRDVEAAAEIAAFLGATLQGVFVENEALNALAGSTLAREFELATRQWRTIQAESISEASRLAARGAKRVLEESAFARGVTSMFEILSCTAAADSLSHTAASDILVVAAPKSPHERLAPPLLQMVAPSTAGLTAMLMPRRVKRRKGPVIGVARSLGDSALRLAAAIAHAADEPLLAVAANELNPEEILEVARSLGVARNIDVIALDRGDTQSFLSMVRHAGERLIVLGRSDEEAIERIDPSAVLSSRSVPVLLVAPDIIVGDQGRMILQTDKLSETQRSA
jgi:hypothetical protein